eukprot:CCRYP_001634-RA/>CCRYP_001634-RA protein AED:0.26 eAED:0.26 QI:79/1/0.5/1/0/0/2/0/66
MKIGSNGSSRRAFVILAFLPLRLAAGTGCVGNGVCRLLSMLLFSCLLVPLQGTVNDGSYGARPGEH